MSRHSHPDAASLLNELQSPHPRHCAGYAGGNGYLTALTLSIGVVTARYDDLGSGKLDAIRAYDLAEAQDAYLGQINMTLVSSFCGPQGLIWGYDVAHVACEALPLSAPQQAQLGIPIFHARPLRSAATALFGTNDRRHFPFLPGSHVLCAGKFNAFRGPARVYAAVAIGIAADRTTSACVLMEDVGTLELAGDAEVQRERLMIEIASSVLDIGLQQRVRYTEVLVDCITEDIEPGQVACPLVAMPYFRLARAAHDPDLTTINLPTWVSRHEQAFLCRHIGAADAVSEVR